MPALQNVFFYFLVLYPLCMSAVWMTGSLIYFFSKERHQMLEVKEEQLPGVTVMVTCYNEEELIASTIESLCHLDYPTFEIIAINDGSKDRTAEILRGMLATTPRLRIIDCKTNRGKANALKLGFAAAKYEFLMCTDADASIEPDAIRRIIPHFVLENVGERVGAVTGNPRVKNRCSLLSKIQILEFASIVGLIKRTQRIWGKIMSLSGVFVMYRKRALLDCGLWDSDTVTEDLGVTWKLQKHFWDMRFEPRALCWMHVPETLRGLYKQRSRWTQGGAEALIRNKGLALRIRHRRFLPIMLEQLISILWAYVFLISIVIQIYGIVVGQNYSFPIGTWGAWIAILCLIQLAFASRIDARYEPHMLRYLFYGIWYPLGYWVFNAIMVYIGIPRALFRRKKKYTTWTSPDRGDPLIPCKEDAQAAAPGAPILRHVAERKPKYGQILSDNPSHTGPECPIRTPARRLRHVIESIMTCLMWAVFAVLAISSANGLVAYFSGRPFIRNAYVDRWIPSSPDHSFVAFVCILAAVVLSYLLMKTWVVFNRKKYGQKRARHFTAPVSVQDTSTFFRIEESRVLDMQERRDIVLEDTFVE